jgi:serine/threonine protein kinase
MPPHHSAASWSLSPDQAELVDEVCNAFEAAWQAVATGGERPLIERHLDKVPAPMRDVLLQELNSLEFAYRKQLGVQLTPQEYRAQSPDSRCSATEPGAIKIASTSPNARSQDRPLVPGYEILKELGSGGMGIVYKARQSSLNRLVAVKMIRDSLFAGTEIRTRFRREATAIARLQHANVIQIHEIGEHEGRLYYSMDFAEGGSMDAKLAGKPLPFVEAAELVKTLALALEHAHQRNVIHRDLKPANVLLTGDGRPLITDFGLAKLLDGDSWSSLTGAILGTACYMAPEQAEGRTREITPATDIYALGAILYELLTARPPFKADSWQATVQQVINDDPLPPTHLRSEIPSNLERVCLKCLAKNPGQRYSAAAELAEDLRRFLAGEALNDATHFPLISPPRIPGFEVLDSLSQADANVRLFKVRDISNNRLASLKMLRGLVRQINLEHYRTTVLPVLNRMNHPRVVRMYHCGVWGSWIYLVQEFVPGGSLRHAIGVEPQPFRETAAVVESLARTLQAAHDYGLVHGNLEPANVLLEADGTARIAEIGLVNQTNEADDDISCTMTRAVEPRFVGNPRYLAPEVLYGAADPLSDIYGLGGILYHMLSGRPPSEGDAFSQVMAHVMHKGPTPLRQLRPDVPPVLDAVCLKCLHKDQRQRFNTSRALADELRFYLDKEVARESLPANSNSLRNSMWRRIIQMIRPKPE